MSELDGFGIRKAPFSSSGQPIQYARRNWITIAAALWLVISVYPVFTFFFSTSSSSSSSSHPFPARAKVTVTRTAVVPAIQTTALGGSITLATLSDNDTANRLPDVIDSFADYTQSAKCTINSLDLHGPFTPLCQDKESLMEAMSSGGRLGFDAPYSPRGCDMRWFSNEEICSILTRFEQINIVGDSMMRNLAVALHVILRTDLVSGGRTNWVPDPDEMDCHCAGVFQHSLCAFHSVTSSRIAWRQEPEKMFCDQDGPASIEYKPLLEHPIKGEDMDDFLHKLDTKKPKKPHVFIMGHGLWNDLDKEQTHAWITSVVLSIQKRLPWLAREEAFFPRLFMTPNAAGVKKPDIFLSRQGNIALARFEQALGPWVKERGIDHLGTWNLTIQSANPDGTHGGMKNNLIKAMMVLNWLNTLEVDKY